MTACILCAKLGACYVSLIKLTNLFVQKHTVLGYNILSVVTDAFAKSCDNLVYEIMVILLQGEPKPFKPYTNRYHVPYKASESTSPFWYSIKRASAYIIVMSSYSAFGKYFYFSVIIFTVVVRFLSNKPDS